MVIEGRKNLAASLLIAAAIVGLFTTNLIAMVLWMIAIRLLQKDKTDVNENATAQLRQTIQRAKVIGIINKTNNRKMLGILNKKSTNKKDDPYIY